QRLGPTGGLLVGIRLRARDGAGAAVGVRRRSGLGQPPDEVIVNGVDDRTAVVREIGWVPGGGHGSGSRRRGRTRAIGSRVSDVIVGGAGGELVGRLE